MVEKIYVTYNQVCDYSCATMNPAYDCAHTLPLYTVLDPPCSRVHASEGRVALVLLVGAAYAPGDLGQCLRLYHHDAQSERNTTRLQPATRH
jgi:hypothetical protein